MIIFCNMKTCFPLRNMVYYFVGADDLSDRKKTSTDSELPIDKTKKGISLPAMNKK